MADSPPQIESLLTKRERIVCAMHWFDRMTRREIAQSLLPEGAAIEDVERAMRMVRMRIKRAKWKLKAAGLKIPARPRKLKVRNFTSAGIYNDRE